MISCSTSSNNCLLLGLLVLRPPISSLLQSATTFITKCDSLQLFYYKVRQVLLQSTEGIKKCDNFITKCDRNYNIMCDDYYKGRQNTLCNKLEMDGRRTGKPNNKYHHRQQQQWFKHVLPFVTQYQPSVTTLKNILMKHWQVIENRPLLKQIYK